MGCFKTSLIRTFSEMLSLTFSVKAKFKMRKTSIMCQSRDVIMLQAHDFNTSSNKNYILEKYLYYFCAPRNGEHNVAALSVYPSLRPSVRPSVRHSLQN
jgi:trehalose/maltose hydrolase-like predicted phosphorylase